MRRRYLVEGEVQGVGYRWYASRLAQRLGVRGWVRNLPDGRVEVLGEGRAEELGEFEAGLRRGPSTGLVTNLRISEDPDETEALISFWIR